MTVGHRPPNPRAGDAREQLTRVPEPLDPEVLHVLPGIPDELKAMYETVADEFDGDRTAETIHTPAPEGALVGAVTNARERFDVAVGSYPRTDEQPGRVKVTGDDPETVADATAWLRDHTETE
jgi:molybdopterin-biosynthesis enzyme MoeA-like protein